MARRGTTRCKYYTFVLFACARTAGRERGEKIKRQTHLQRTDEENDLSKEMRERQTYSNRYFYLVTIGKELQSCIRRI